MENRKKFLDDFAAKLNIKKPSDWGKIKSSQFQELGGASLLSYYYNSSPYACLKSVYKGIFANSITKY